MSLFDPGKRREFIKILRKLINDEETFKVLTKKIAYEIPKKIAAINKDELKDHAEAHTEWEDLGDTDEIIEAAQKMFYDYGQIIHLFYELRRNGTLNVSGKENKKTFERVYSLCKELQKELGDMRNALCWSRLNQEDAHHFLSKQIVNKIEVFLQSEHQEIEEIEASIRGGLDISQKRVYYVEDGTFRVELHVGYEHIDFAFGREMHVKNECKFGLLIFDRDFLVAVVKLFDFSHKEIFAKLTMTEIRGHGYVQRAIELLLLKGKIKAWHSDKMLSRSASEMYERIGEDKRFTVYSGAPSGRLGRVDSEYNVKLAV